MRPQPVALALAVGLTLNLLAASAAALITPHEAAVQEGGEGPSSLALAPGSDTTSAAGSGDDGTGRPAGEAGGLPPLAPADPLQPGETAGAGTRSATGGQPATDAGSPPGSAAPAGTPRAGAATSGEPAAAPATAPAAGTLPGALASPPESLTPSAAPAPAPPLPPDLTVTGAAHGLVVSDRADRSDVRHLASATLHGLAFVHLVETDQLTRVRFWFDDPSLSGPAWREDTDAPFDFVDGTAAVATAWDTSAVTPGHHRLTAIATRPDGSTTRYDAEFSVVASAQPVDPGYQWGPDTFWRAGVADAPLHPDSAAMSAHLRASFADLYGGVAAFNVWHYNNSYYAVDEATPAVAVTFDDCQGKGYYPSGWDPLFSAVPIPEGALPAVGNDRALSIYSTATDTLWEFWRANETADGWTACWGGRIDDVSDGDGRFPDFWGATATGLANSAGMIRISDARSGRIDHAVSIAIPQPAHHSTFSWPAQRSDGSSTDPHALPEGIRLRLSSDVDVPSLGLHPVAEMVAIAAQEYGMVVTDRAGTVSFTTESGRAEKARTGTDPWVELLGGTPGYAVMAGFPWEHVEVLPMDYGKP